MTPLLPALPLQASGDALSTFLDLLPIIALIVLIVGAMIWILGFISRYFQYLKTVESTWLDQPTLDFVHHVLEGVWIVFTVILVLAVAGTQSQALHDALTAVVARVPAAFFVIFVMFAAAVAVRVLHRFAAYLRGELKAKPKRTAPANVLGVVELVLKYIIYIGALAVALLGGIRALPDADRAAISSAVGGLPEIKPALLVEVVVGLLFILIADRFVVSIFEDMKRHTKKFSQQVLDEVKSIARYGVWLVGAVILFFIVITLLLSETGLVIFAVGFISVLVIAAVLGFETTRNLLAGLALMRADPFDPGDRVKIGDEMVCDVLAMGLTLTRLRTLRGELVQMPNARLLSMPILNFTRSKPYAVSVEVSVGFRVDHNRVRDLLVSAAAETEGIVKDRAPEVFGKDVAGDRVVYQLFAYTDHPERMKEIKSALIYRIQDLFGSAGITP